MKYLCLVYQEGASPDGAYDTIVGESIDYRDQLLRSGRYVASSVLQPLNPAARVWERGGRVFVSDVPRAAENERLREYYLIDARDLNDALLVAAKMPAARLGYVEVWPAAELNPP
jgi:hypothetical protein